MPGNTTERITLEAVARNLGETTAQVRNLGLAVDRLAQESKKSGAAQEVANQQFAKTPAVLSSIQSSIIAAAGAWVSFHGAMRVGRFIIDTQRMAGQMQAASAVLDQRLRPAGISAAAGLRQLQDATYGVVTSAQLLPGAARAMQVFSNAGVSAAQAFDVVRTSAEFATLAAQSFGINANEAFNRLVTGLSRGSALILDDFGIIINEQRAMSRGMTESERKVYVLNEAVRQMTAFINENRDAIEDSLPTWDKWITKLRDAAIEFVRVRSEMENRLLIKELGADARSGLPPRMKTGTASPYGSYSATDRALTALGLDVKTGPSTRLQSPGGRSISFSNSDYLKPGPAREAELWARTMREASDEIADALLDSSADIDLAARATANTLGAAAPKAYGGLTYNEWVLRNLGYDAGGVFDQAAVGVPTLNDRLPTIDTSGLIERAAQPGLEQSFMSQLSPFANPSALIGGMAGGMVAGIGMNIANQVIGGPLSSMLTGYQSMLAKLPVIGNIFGDAADKQMDAALMQMRAAESLTRTQKQASLGVAYATFFGDDEGANIARFNESSATWYESIYPTLGTGEGIPWDYAEKQREIYQLIQEGDIEAARAITMESMSGPMGLRGLFTEEQISSGKVTDFFNAFNTLESALDANTDALDALNESLVNDILRADILRGYALSAEGARSEAGLTQITGLALRDIQAGRAWDTTGVTDYGTTEPGTEWTDGSVPGVGGETNPWEKPARFEIRITNDAGQTLAVLDERSSNQAIEITTAGGFRRRRYI